MNVMDNWRKLPFLNILRGCGWMIILTGNCFGFVTLDFAFSERSAWRISAAFDWENSLLQY